MSYAANKTILKNGLKRIKHTIENDKELQKRRKRKEN
jgi:hypothetical protein